MNTIENSTTYTILGGAGNDSISNNANNTSLVGGNGRDTINNYNTSVTIDGGAGNDLFYNNGKVVCIAAGDGDDLIRLDSNSDSVTIEGGAGNDTLSISNGAANILYLYKDGEGSDILNGFKDTSTLQIDGAAYSTQISCSDMIVLVGDGSITLRGAASLETVHIEGAEKNPLIRELTEDADKVKVTLDSATVLGYAGDDSIVNLGDAAVIVGDEGSDTIRSYGDAAVLEGGDGPDFIRNYGDNATISGDAGNDTIRNYGSNVTLLFDAKDGSDVIYGFDETSTLQISGAAYSTQISGSNVIVTVGDGRITLRGAASLETLHIDGTEAFVVDDKTSSPLSLTSGIEYVDASSRTLAVKITGNKLNNTLAGGTGNDTLLGGAGDDSIAGGSGNDKLYGGSGNDMLVEGAGNDSLWGNAGSDTFLYAGGTGKDVLSGFDNSDMLEITGDWKAAYYKVAGKVSFTVDGTAGAVTLKDFTATTFNINGDTYRISGNKLVKK